MASVATAVVKALALPAIATALSTASPIAAAFIVGGIATAATAAVTLFFNAVHGIGLGVGALRENRKNILDTMILFPTDGKNKSDTNMPQHTTSSSKYLHRQFNAVYLVPIADDKLPTATTLKEILNGKNEKNYPVMIRLTEGENRNTLFTLNKKGDLMILRDNLTTEEIKLYNEIFDKPYSYAYTRLTEEEKNLFRSPEPESNLQVTKGWSIFSNFSSNKKQTVPKNEISKKN